MYGREYTHVTLKVQLPGDFEEQPSAERVRLISEAHL
jgi:hypothetical protein